MALLGMLGIPDWALAIIVIGLIIYYLGTKNYDYYAKRNIPYIQPSKIPFLGNSGPMIFMTQSFPDYIIWMYNQLKGHPYGGSFSFASPLLIIRDPELIRHITVKDFDHFTDHQTMTTSENDPFWGKGLFNLQGEKWRDMRHTLSPVFTSSKMKTMFILVEECGKQIRQFLDKCSGDFTPDKICKIEKEKGILVVEMRDLFTRFATDVIATAAFGVGVDSLMEPSNEFFMLGTEAANFGAIRSLILMGYMVFPKLMCMLNIKILPTKVTSFFRSLVFTTMTTREKEGIVRPDLIHLLMQLKKGTLQDEKAPSNGNKLSSWIKDDDLAAQAFLFFLAGFDTTSTLLCFVTHQLAVHPEVQTRLQNEIDKTMKSTGGHLTYDSLQDMKYLGMVISETLRLYSPASAADRKCVKTYTVPSNPPHRLEPNDLILIPFHAIHHDPEHFPEPDRFDPERFSEENKHNIKPFTYMPFGLGPRSCIANRFALMECKIALAHLLSGFNLKVMPKTPIPIQITKKGFNLRVDGGFWLGLEQRNITLNI